MACSNKQTRRQHKETIVGTVTGFIDRAKGKTAISTQYMSKGGAYYSSAEDAITATPSGTQATSRLLGQQQSRITTVATAGDGVRLPPAIAEACVVVVNDAAVNAMNVWPSSAAQGGVTGGDKINVLAQNAAFSQTVALGVVIYYCFSNGTWRTK
jgi:hypothetical protein